MNEWIEIGTKRGSIHYDTSIIYDKWVSTEVVRWFYVAVVVPPFFLVLKRRVRIFGILLAASLLVAYVFYDYAFISVWCFFAAIISLYIVYLLYRRAHTVKE